MSDGKPKTEPKPPPGFSAFKAFLAKLAKVPKAELDEKEAEYQRDRSRSREERGTG